MSGRLPWVCIRSPKFLCLPPIFRNSLVGGWILPELGENRSCRNQNRKNACEKTVVRILCRHLAPDMHTHQTAAPIFSTCYELFQGCLAWRPLAPLFCGPGLGQKNLEIFSSRLGVTSKIGSLYFVWTSGPNIYKHGMSPRSKHPPRGQAFQHRSVLLHSCREIQQRSSLVHHRQLARKSLPELFVPVILHS